MKKTFILVLSLLALGLVAHAREVVSVGVYAGVPYYAEPAPYYVPTADPVWYGTPVSVIYIDGYPHRMHLWQGQWYDEAWIGHGHPYYGRAIYYNRGWDHRRGW